MTIKKRLIISSLIGVTALTAVSLSLSLAWYSSGDRLSISSVDLTLKTDPLLKVSTSNDLSTFVDSIDLNSDEYDEGSEKFLFKHAEYECISSIAPVRDSHDYISNYDPSNPTSVCETRADDNHLGRVTMTVYLEGWDFAVIDEEIAHSFDLGLTFEMSRL